MRGNIYICLNKQTYNSNLPDVFDRYKKASFDEDGNLIELLPTTYAEAAEDNKPQYGDVLEITVDGKEYFIINMDASFLEGEVTYLLKLGEGLSYPSNSLLNREEVIELYTSANIE